MQVKYFSVNRFSNESEEAMNLLEIKVNSFLSGKDDRDIISVSYSLDYLHDKIKNSADQDRVVCSAQVLYKT